MALPTDSTIAALLVTLYSGQAADPGVFDFYEPGNGDSGICWAAKRLDGVTLILMRGSRTLEDWFRDFLALRSPWQHDAIGSVHPGFNMGLDRTWAEIKARTQEPWVLGGHSLGAGRADILTGLMLEDGVAPICRVLFGEPKPGFADFASYIHGVPVRSYRNRRGFEHDPVTSVPFYLPLLEYVHPAPLTDVTAVPDAVELALRGEIAWHSMNLYAQALATATSTDHT